MKTFRSSPATFTITYPTGESKSFITVTATLEDVFGEQCVRLSDGDDDYDNLFFSVASIEVDVENQFVATTPNGARIELRATTPGDAMVAGLADYPLPIDVISGLVTGVTVTTQLEALVDDDGMVVTVMLVDGTGMWLRYSGTWIPVKDPNLIDGYESRGIEPESLDLYDRADQNGGQVDIRSMTLTGGDFDVSSTFVYEPETPVETVVSSGMVTLPTIHTARDVPAAIQAALENPDARWYVENRVRALKVDVELPWQS